jgi:antitoxin (DNA-binding transcriptional repressor) of toxin-antitoxin stability system
MQRVTVEQAQAQLEALIRSALDGEEVVIEHDGQAVQLVPVSRPPGRPCFGSAHGWITMADDFDAPLDDFATYRS